MIQEQILRQTIEIQNVSNNFKNEIIVREYFEHYQSKENFANIIAGIRRCGKS